MYGSHLQMLAVVLTCTAEVVVVGCCYKYTAPVVVLVVVGSSIVAVVGIVDPFN